MVSVRIQIGDYLVSGGFCVNWNAKKNDRLENFQYRKMQINCFAFVLFLKQKL